MADNTPKAFISRTVEQRATRKALSATPEQIATSAYTEKHIRYMESLGWVLRIQDDRFVLIEIARDGSYHTEDLEKD